MKFIAVVALTILAVTSHSKNNIHPGIVDDSEDCNVHRVSKENNKCLCDLKENDWVENTCLRKCSDHTERVGKECKLKCHNDQERVGSQCLAACPAGSLRAPDLRCQKVKPPIPCPPPNELVAGECLEPCSGNNERIDGTCRPKCGNGQERVGAKCFEKCGNHTERVADLCVEKCGNGKERIDGICKDICGVNQERFKGECKDKCPVDYKRNEAGDCAYCPNGEFASN